METKDAQLIHAFLSVRKKWKPTDALKLLVGVVKAINQKGGDVKIDEEELRQTLEQEGRRIPYERIYYIIIKLITDAEKQDPEFKATMDPATEQHLKNLHISQLTKL